MASIAPPTLQLNVTLKQGADATITLTVVDANGAAITTTTGYTVRAQIRSSPAGTVLFEWNTITGPGLGTVTFTYSAVTLTSTVVLTTTAAQSALFTFQSAQWDCLLTSPAGQVTCLAEGTIVIDPYITH